MISSVNGLFALPGCPALARQSLILAGSLYELRKVSQPASSGRCHLYRLSARICSAGGWIPKNPSQRCQPNIRKTVPSRGGCGGSRVESSSLLGTLTAANRGRLFSNNCPTWFTATHHAQTARPPHRRFLLHFWSYLARSLQVFFQTPCVSTSRCGSARQFPPLARVSRRDDLRLKPQLASLLPV